MIVLMADTIGVDAARLPRGLAKVAGYVTGSGGILWSERAWTRFKGVRVPIDQQAGRIRYWPEHPTLVVDVETGAKTISEAVQTAAGRARLRLRTTVYIQGSRLAAARAAVAAERLAGWVDYWVANWSLSQAEASALLGHGGVVAIQFASPTSNPRTRLPGSRLTLAQANADLSVTLASWAAPPAPPAPRPRPKPRPKVKPHPKVLGSSAGALLGVAITAVLHAAGVTLSPAESSAIATLAGALAGYITPAKGHP